VHNWNEFFQIKVLTFVTSEIKIFFSHNKRDRASTHEQGHDWLSKASFKLG